MKADSVAALDPNSFHVDPTIILDENRRRLLTIVVDDDEILEGQRLTRYADLVSDQVDENAA